MAGVRRSHSLRRCRVRCRAEVFVRLSEVTEVDAGTVVVETYRACKTLVTVRLLMDGRLGWVTSSPPISGDEILAAARSTASSGSTVPRAFTFSQDQAALTLNPPAYHLDAQSMRDQVFRTGKEMGAPTIMRITVTTRSDWRLIANSGGLRAAGTVQRVRVSLSCKPTRSGCPPYSQRVRHQVLPPPQKGLSERRYAAVVKWTLPWDGLRVLRLLSCCCHLLLHGSSACSYTTHASRTLDLHLPKLVTRSGQSALRFVTSLSKIRMSAVLTTKE